ncbi:MAG: agmatine deiminase family protein, partial [Candidatus Schekmanbacteria bacterium]
MPAEWERHEAVWLSWPYDESTFPDRIKEVENIYLKIISALHNGEKINLLVKDEEMKNRVEKTLLDYGINLYQVVFHIYDYADVWFRDYGPIFLVNKREKALSIVKWQFNAWGEKYEELIKDTNIPYLMNEKLNLPLYSPNIVLEGGSIDVNGEGVLLTTKQCLLNKNRNKKLKVEEIEYFLREYLGVRDIIWLEGGVDGDDTDGHIDDVARFVNENTVLACFEADENDVNYNVLKKNYEILLNYRTAEGKRLNVVKLPMPKPIEINGQRLPASYANFYIGNSAVLVPVFNQPTDTEAIEIIGAFFPERKIVAIDCNDLIVGFGAIHCITQQQPLLEG